MRLGDLDALKEAYFNAINETSIGEVSIIDIIDNAPTVETFTKDDMAGAYNEGYACGSRENKRPQGDLISRQDAIDALEEQLDYLQMLNKNENPTAEGKWYGVNWARNTIADLSSAQKKGGAE